jgi:FlaA1/EpsC-like NDP-sugar epimerase
VSSQSPRHGVDRRGFLGRFGPLLEHNRFFVQSLVDVAAWFVALPLAVVVRFEVEFDPAGWGSFSLRGVLAACMLAGVFQISVGAGSGLYRARWRYGSFEEVAHLVLAVFGTTVALAVLNKFAFDQWVPASVTLFGGLVAVMIMAAVRYSWRLLLERKLRPTGENLTRTMIFGAGEAGTRLLATMLRNPDSPYLPVAILDEDPDKQKLRLMGVPVVGGRDDIESAAHRFKATTLVLAVPSAPADLLRSLSDHALAAGLDVKILPPLRELLDGAVGVGDIRPITEADLLGRGEVDTNLEAISGYLTGRRVLVTGAGGSIGSELSHQISRLAPDRLVLLDRDESALHAVQLRIEGRAMLDSRDLVVCDIRDHDALRRVFDEHRPEVVFHAAALKHLPLLEMYPDEALKTNVYGTANVLEHACAFGVDKVVNVSTDKAADPSSVLGYTKRLAERLTAATAQTCPGTYLSVRFGNVLGSRGSVLTAFEQQVEAGGPITVTHPDVTRYFMTVEESVQLVIQAGAVGRDGEALVLDMGEPVRIDDVARRLARRAERHIDIVYTGLRPGEKLHEILLAEGEADERPAHPLISHVAVPPVQIEDVRLAFAQSRDRDDTVAELRGLAAGPNAHVTRPGRD